MKIYRVFEVINVNANRLVFPYTLFSYTDVVYNYIYLPAYCLPICSQPKFILYPANTLPLRDS